MGTNNFEDLDPPMATHCLLSLPTILTIFFCFQPQRIRVRGDENAPPLQQNKSLHQRNKSMSALNTTVARNTTRRAFGDVSNTNNKDQRTTRDDFVLVEKPVQVTEKPALSQPAQRPASIAGNKGLLNTVTTKPVNPAGKAHPTKTNKRNNVVFRDNENLETVIEKEASKESAPAVRREPAVEEQAKSKELEKVDKVDSVSAPGKKEKSVGSTVNSKDDVSSIDKLETNEVDDVAVVAASAENSMANPNLSEPEEYWDEDETFAHLPHSDNTTGGFTTVVFPKYSAQTRHEILMAKEIVEATRTEEDIMEDFYDTSMVAEYTSEIFLFMRQKEVCLPPPSLPPPSSFPCLSYFPALDASRNSFIYRSRCFPSRTTWITRLRSSGPCVLS